MSIIDKFISNAQPYWRAYVEHDFVQQLGQGTLSKASFQHYLKQDYLFLFQYSRANSLGIFKAENFEQIFQAQQMNADLLQEIQLHIDFCKSWGISEQELFSTPESSACIAYTRYVLDCGIKGGLAELYVALAPCAIGYAEIGKRLSEQGSGANNPYQDWINTYADPEFQKSAQNLADNIEKLCADLTASQLEKLQHIFNTATRMEMAFWQMGLDLS
ncbi:thiaminase II [Otariodibacter oris]|uniref:Aminopyrimidine aminohydrolase n=1 Tax=Otariodibacter oris TaxID=1032623 RepID=A0A420XIJ5_9PAST|nr:thiaminase II [Otariodibacter oris]QGM80646.1 thiaminase II [Otariodibacter oris]RKR77194.1 thiaminase/transcriptional activator TenA [Otariodibacter oris]